MSDAQRADDARHAEPKTVPPPRGASDMYSAPTRVGTLPEEVLAAMRAGSKSAVSSRVPNVAAMSDVPNAPAMSLASSMPGDRWRTVRLIGVVALFAAVGVLAAIGLSLVRDWLHP